MALVPATITVLFTSNYTGDHRVCWKECSAVVYDCTTIVTCLGGGTGCSTTISVIVDDEACVDACFDGYVQAVCEAESSVVGRIAWTTSYVPTNACENIEFTCAGMGASCPAFDILTDFDCGGTTVDIPEMQLGSVFGMCYPPGTVLVAPPSYTLSTGATACCDCYSVEFIAPSALATTGIYFYQDCTTQTFVQGTLTTGDLAVVVCAITGSEGFEYNSTITTVIGAVCP